MTTHTVESLMALAHRLGNAAMMAAEQTTYNSRAKALESALREALAQPAAEPDERKRFEAWWSLFTPNNDKKIADYQEHAAWMGWQRSLVEVLLNRAAPAAPQQDALVAQRDNDGNLLAFRHAALPEPPSKPT